MGEVGFGARAFCWLEAMLLCGAGVDDDGLIRD